MRIRTATLFERTFEDILSCGHKYYSRNTIKHLYTEYKKCRAILLDNPYYEQLETILDGFQLEYRRVYIKPYLRLSMLLMVRMLLWLTCGMFAKILMPCVTV